MTEQLTKEQAILFGENKMYLKMTHEEIVRFQLFQKNLCMPFSVFHEAIEKVLDRPVYTHEFGLNYEGLVKEYLGEQDPPTFEEIINLIPEDKRVIINL